MAGWVKGWPTWVKWVAGVFVVITVIGAISGGGNHSATADKSSGGPGGSGTAAGAKKSEPSAAAHGCGTEATDDCTPHVGAKGTVKVDGLVWKLQSVETASTIGDQTYGLGAKANGVYLIAHLKVTSTKDESVSITDEVVTLATDGDSYSTDSDGTFAAEGDGENTFAFEDIGPNSTLHGVAVFDVPRSILKSNLELTFGELGFGSTEGSIALPKL